MKELHERPTGSRTGSSTRFIRYVRNFVLYGTLASFASCDGCKGSTEPDVEPNLNITVNPLLIDVAQGTSGQFTVTVERIGFSGPVALDLPEALPAGNTITFDPAVIPSGSTTSTGTITLTANANVVITNGSPSIVTAVVRGKAEGIENRFSRIMYSPVLSADAGFTLATSPPTLTLRPGQSGDAQLTINRQGNFSGPITLKTSVLLSDVTATITPVAGQTDRYLAHIEVPAATKPSSDPVRVTVTGTSSGVRSNFVDLSVFIMDATIGIKSDHDVSMRAGGQDTVTMKVSRGVWFSAPVTLSLENAPAGMTGTFASNPADGGSLLTIRTASTVAPGTYEVQVRGTPPAASGASDATYILGVTVEPPIVANAYVLIPPNMNVVAGSNASSIFNVTRGVGYTEPITVTFARAGGTALPAGMTLSLDQNPITQTFTTIRLNTTGATPAGTYAIVATGRAANANDVTANFNVVVTEAPRATTIQIGKLVNGVPQATTSETIVVSQTVPLRAIVFDQNGQGMPGESVTWTSTNPVNATVSDNGDVFGFGSGTATIFATSKSNPAIRSSVFVEVVLPPTTNVARMVLEPGNAEITAPATQEYSVALYNSAGAKIDLEAGTTVRYSSSNPSVATVNDITGIAKGVSAGTVTIRATYSRNGVTVREASVSLLVYAPGTAGHYGSAYISTNSNNTRTVRAGQALLFQLYVFDVNNLQKPTGVTPAPVITSSNPNVTITPSTITGGYFYTMNVGTGLAVGTTFTIRYDVTGAGGEIVMTVVP